MKPPALLNCRRCEGPEEYKDYYASIEEGPGIYVNEFLEEEKETGRIDELAEEYIYRYVRQETDEAA